MLAIVCVLGWGGGVGGRGGGDGVGIRGFGGDTIPNTTAVGEGSGEGRGRLWKRWLVVVVVTGVGGCCEGVCVGVHGCMFVSCRSGVRLRYMPSVDVIRARVSVALHGRGRVWRRKKGK